MYFGVLGKVTVGLSIKLKKLVLVENLKCKDEPIVFQASVFYK
jgi:hypothetical protein